MREQAVDTAIGESFTAQAFLKTLDGVGQRRRIEAAQGLQSLGCQGCFHSTTSDSIVLVSTFWPGLSWDALPSITKSPSRSPETTSYLVDVSSPSVTGRSSIS